MMTLKRRLEEEFLLTVKKYNMILAGDRVLCAVSGGADSLCLLELLYKYRDSFNIKLSCAHINHCIRGKEADDDEQKVREECEKRGIELFVLKKDVPLLAKKLGLGLEQTAREVRYDYFDLLCNKYGFNKIAVAHNSTDNSETVLFNLIRGSGLSGLKGISPIRDKIIRPLINVNKDDIRNYCREYGLNFCVDSTNSDIIYTRNRLRNNVIPELMVINNLYDKNIRKACDTISEDLSYIHSEAKKYIDENCSNGIIEGKSFRKLHISLKKRVLTILYQAFLSNNNIVLDSINLNDALTFIDKSTSGKYIMLPQDVIFYCSFDNFCFKKDVSKCSNKKVNLTEGKNYFENEIILLKAFEKNASSSPDIVYTLFKQAFLDYDKIKGEIFVRTRMEADKIYADGITKSVKEYFINRKIPVTERNSYPIICDNEGIIWVPEMCVADRVKIDGQTKNVITIKIINNEEEKENEI